MAIVRNLARLGRALIGGHPLRRLHRGALRAFPYEVGYLRFLRLTGFATRPPRTNPSPDAATRQIGYSRSFLEGFSPDRRIEWTMCLLASAPDLEKDSLLVVGPRYEPELLLAQGMGWDPEGMRGLDTFSYSPFIDVGDMHALPYADDAFSGLVCGWTLSYSSRPEQAVAEMQRVVKPGGYLVVAVQKVWPGFVETLDEVLKGDDRVQTLEQFDALYDRCTRVAGFERADVRTGDEAHTIALYRKDSSVGS